MATSATKKISSAAAPAPTIDNSHSMDSLAAINIACHIPTNHLLQTSNNRIDTFVE